LSAFCNRLNRIKLLLGDRCATSGNDQDGNECAELKFSEHGYPLIEMISRAQLFPKVRNTAIKNLIYVAEKQYILVNLRSAGRSLQV
jgi:hypothetical protein